MVPQCRIDIHPELTPPDGCRFDVDADKVLSADVEKSSPVRHCTDSASIETNGKSSKYTSSKNSLNAHKIPVSEIIKSAYQNGNFWSLFSLSKSNPDGHCLLHSLISCLNRVHNSELTIAIFLSILTTECKHFEKKYKCYYQENTSNFYNELNDYVYSKKYDSLFCELIPAIMANALNHIIVVVNENPHCDVNVYDFMPIEYEAKNPICRQCGRKLGILTIIRRSAHYDACLQSNKGSQPCSCNISHLSKLNSDNKIIFTRNI